MSDGPSAGDWFPSDIFVFAAARLDDQLMAGFSTDTDRCPCVLGLSIRLRLVTFTRAWRPVPLSSSQAFSGLSRTKPDSLMLK